VNPSESVVADDKDVALRTAVFIGADGMDDFLD